MVENAPVATGLRVAIAWCHLPAREAQPALALLRRICGDSLEDDAGVVRRTSDGPGRPVAPKGASELPIGLLANTDMATFPDES
jgi:hypothetical protein